MKKLQLLLFLLLVSINWHCQSKHTNLGEEYARKFLADVQQGKGSLLSQVIPIVRDKETAIAIAEAVLFKIYGKDQIIKQRPYEVYQIENHWVLFGMLPEDTKGGVFEIAIDAQDGRIVGLIHGK
ncbi:NTF2 fold immunity protein [Cytophagaceae bacterium DM2B3-1]|uniref:NTF2 fold immunity protein n=1 Tax=Xanthocytophaga flava TaxID=3048013 RepID=A0ABT7CE79_9BACT|nr:NTF2 fold immunity protein [Xanthocytophaga flavus]MDJ1468873.1 NTF2 fold immunity protein [Xanthocytophaga flavus]MDJ1492047.1 NTF2 fold immunity protein [Xanthocytophaga flavus]